MESSPAIAVTPTTSHCRPNVLIFGVGAVGTCYLHLLLEAGCQVTAVCRSNYSVAKRHGFTLNSTSFGHHLRHRPCVVREVEDLREMNFDYVLVTTKAFPGTSPCTAELLQPVVTSDRTPIAILQNGIGIEEEYESCFPSNPIVSCVVNLHAVQIHPAVVEMQGLQLLELGPSSPQSRQRRYQQSFMAAATLRNLILKGGGKAHLFHDIQPRRWLKLLANATWNPICALTRINDVSVLHSSSEAVVFVERLMGEIVDTAHALGYYCVSLEAAKERLRSTLDQSSSFGWEPSMSADVRRKRSLEVEAILGNAIRIAKTQNVEVVNLEALYVLICGLDVSLRE